MLRMMLDTRLGLRVALDAFEQVALGLQRADEFLCGLGDVYSMALTILCSGPKRCRLARHLPPDAVNDVLVSHGTDLAWPLSC
jgi:hypothetical protein